MAMPGTSAAFSWRRGPWSGSAVGATALGTLARPDRHISADVRHLLESYAGAVDRWTGEVTAGVATIAHDDEPRGAADGRHRFPVSWASACSSGQGRELSLRVDASSVRVGRQRRRRLGDREVRVVQSVDGLVRDLAGVDLPWQRLREQLRRGTPAAA